MNSGIYEAMVERMNALEARVAELEKKTSEPETAGGVEARIRRAHPIAMTKSEAAQILNVTRATVYCMIKDGRLTENGWRKVTTDSLINLMNMGTSPVRKPRGRNLRMGADD